jgi:polyhydroxybutyrate depolymerase
MTIVIFPKRALLALGVLPLLAVSSLLGASPAASATHPRLAPMNGSYRFELRSGGMARTYRLHVPPQAASGRPLPLVLNLHGSTQNAFLQEVQSQMDGSADQNGYLVAYPNGTRVSAVLTPDPVAKQAQYSWNAGVCCGLPVTHHVNDVGFLKSVIANVASRTPVDLRRVYVTGMSSGGMMAYAMAAEDSAHIAAIASVSGQVELPAIHPTHAVPTMEFHSVDDPIAKWDGTPSKNPALRYSVMQGISKWAKADHCSSTPHKGKPLVGAPGTVSVGETATLITYSHCRSGTEVSLWRLTGSGHVWPGSPLNTGPPSSWVLGGVGRGTVLIDANRTMWQFFERYSTPSAPSTSTH